MAGTQEIDTTFDAGGVAFAGEKPKFDNLKVGDDDNSDGDLADAAGSRKSSPILAIWTARLYITIEATRSSRPVTDRTTWSPSSSTARDTSTNW